MSAVCPPLVRSFASAPFARSALTARALPEVTACVNETALKAKVLENELGGSCRSLRSILQNAKREVSTDDDVLCTRAPISSRSSDRCGRKRCSSRAVSRPVRRRLPVPHLCPRLSSRTNKPRRGSSCLPCRRYSFFRRRPSPRLRSEEYTSELQSHSF